MLEDWWGAVWDAIRDAVDTYRAERTSWVVLATGAGALLAVLVDAVWRRARNVVTIVHEGGHAVAALLTGRRLTGIRLHSDTSGLTLSVGRPRGPGMILTAAAGYVSPSLVGLAGVALLTVDQVTVLLWASTVVVAGMLIMVRNLYGALSLVVTGGALVAVSLLATPQVQASFGYAMTWFLLLGGVRPVGELVRERRRNAGTNTDADHLARLTHLPAGVWVAVFGLTSLGSLAVGAWFLVG